MNDRRNFLRSIIAALPFAGAIGFGGAAKAATPRPYNFDGKSDWIFVAERHDATCMGSLTMTAWVYPYCLSLEEIRDIYETP